MFISKEKRNYNLNIQIFVVEIPEGYASLRLLL